MESQNYILIAADDTNLIRDLAAYLKSMSYSPATLKQPDLLETKIASGIRLIILGSKYQGKDGLAWCSEIRRYSSIPICIINGSTNELTLSDAVLAGADDLLDSPVDTDRLGGRVMALLRRTYEYSSEKEIPIGYGLFYVPETGTLRHDGGMVDLTRTEQKMMDLLCHKRGTPVSRDELMQALWQTSEFICDGTLSTSISRLRAKLKQVCGHKVIQTRKGTGYIIP